MARCPFAVWRPITADKLAGPGLRPRLALHYRITLHVTGDHKDTEHPYFNQAGIPDSHFHVDYAGEIEQYVDTDDQAFADLEGNDATVSIETTGGADGQWTPVQVASIIRLLVWLYRAHPYNPATGDGFPVQMATDSRVGMSSHGLAWHRLGIDGNFPALPSILAGRTQRGGGMHWSTARGKVCPGDDRIDQVPGIFDAVRAQLSDPAAPTPAPEPPTPDPIREEDLMATPDLLFVKDPKAKEVWLVRPSDGKRRHVTSGEWAGWKARGAKVTSLSAAQIKTIPEAS